MIPAAILLLFQTATATPTPPPSPPPATTPPLATSATAAKAGDGRPRTLADVARDGRIAGGQKKATKTIEIVGTPTADLSPETSLANFRRALAEGPPEARALYRACAAIHGEETLGAFKCFREKVDARTLARPIIVLRDTYQERPDSIGSVWMGGTVVNAGSVPACGIKVRVEIREGERILASNDTYLQPSRLEPNESGTFRTYTTPRTREGRGMASATAEPCK